MKLNNSAADLWIIKLDNEKTILSAICSVDSVCVLQIPPPCVNDENILYDRVAELGANGQYEEAISVSDSILQLNITDSLKAYIMLERMLAFGNMGEMNQAKAYVDEVIDFSKKHGISEVTINALASKGVMYRRNEMTDSALIYYRQALKIATDEKNLEYEQYISDLLSILYLEMPRPKEAMLFSRRSFDIAREMNDTVAMVSAISTIGNIYIGEEEYRKTLDVLKPYMPMVKKVGAPGYVMKYLSPVINAYLSLGETDSVRRYMKMAEPFVAQLPENHQTAVFMLNAEAKLLGQEKRYEEQLKIYNRLDSLDSHGRSACLELHDRAECHDGIGDSHRAYELMQQAYWAMDSIRRSEVETEKSELSVKYDTLQKEIEIERLSKERLVWISISTILAILAIAIIFLLRYKREKFRQKMMLEKQEVYIRGLESERERLAKELHDGICNEMQAMTFTLADDEKALEQMRAIIAKTRRLSHELMPPQFKDGNICQLLLSYVMMMNDSHPETRITITDEGCYAWETLSAEHGFELYRMVQESVGNALVHATPSYIAIMLDGTADSYAVAVENDGAGGDEDAGAGAGIGRRTLQARADSIGATVDIMHEDGIYRVTIQHK